MDDPQSDAVTERIEKLEELVRLLITEKYGSAEASYDAYRELDCHHSCYIDT